MRGANEQITIWNRYKDAAKHDVWVHHIVDRCSWESDIMRRVEGGSAVYASGYDVQIAENDAYKPRAEWLALDPVAKSIYFTIGVGDVVARGGHGKEIGDGVTMTELKLLLAPDIFTVSAFFDGSAGYKRGRHYELMGV